MRVPEESAEQDGVEELPEEIVVRLTDERAIVFSARTRASTSRWGNWITDFTPKEVASFVQTVDAATRAFIERQRLTAHLVELDPASREMWKRGFQVVVEDGGWVQANLRENGRFARVMRIRTPTGLAAVAGPIAVLGALAAQAQAAEMAHTIELMSRRVDAIYRHLQTDQKSAAQNAVAQVYDLVELVREHGHDAVGASDIQTVRVYLGDTRQKCMGHLADAVSTLEKGNTGAPRNVEKSVTSDDVNEAVLYLDLIGGLHVAQLELELAQIALDYRNERFAVVATRTAKLAKSTDQFSAHIDALLSRLAELDQAIRAKFQPTPTPSSLFVVSKEASKALAGATRRHKIPIRLQGTNHSIPVQPMAALAGALVLPAVVGVNALAQTRAQRKLESRLGQLLAATRGAASCLDESRAHVEVLRATTEELAATAR